jgi:hypothetical protein
VSYTRSDLITEALANLGIVRLTDTGASRTRVDLINNAAERLGVLASGQTLSAEDSANIDQHLDPLIAYLNTHAIVTIPNANAIPAGMFLALADMLANEAKGHYESDGLATKQLEAEADTAKLSLYAFGGAPLVDRNLKGILAELGNDDLVSVVDTSDIPDEWFPSLSWIVADRVKGKFPLISPDRVAMAKAEGAEAVLTLRRITRGRPSYNRFVPEWV